MIPSLNFAVLTDALHALKEGNIRHCEALGFTFDEMNALNHLSLDELFIISRASAQFMAVTVHHDALHQILALSRQEVQRQQQINRAMTLGGSIALLNQYFGLTSNEVCIRRRLLGITIPHGRTPIPDEETDAEIWRQWQKRHPGNIASLDALDVMMQIAEELSSQGNGPSLTAVLNRITLCEKKHRTGGHRMPDEIDRDQEFNEQRLEDMIEQNRFKSTTTPSLPYCRLCGKSIPDKRRQTLPGVTTYIECQTALERHQR